jgi:hypothetical protein
MRTTLTLDADVSAALEALRRREGLSLEAAVNAALRHGLRAMAAGDKRTSPFVTTSVDIGAPRLPLDNVAAALAAAEGDRFH